jgi:hypothetical protein
VILFIANTTILGHFYPIGDTAVFASGDETTQISNGVAIALPQIPGVVVALVPTSVDDFNPYGFNPANTISLALTPASGGSTINGLKAVAHGNSVWVQNQSSSDSITFPHLAGTSAAANQFVCPAGGPQTLTAGASCLIRYSQVTSQWRFVS